MEQLEKYLTSDRLDFLIELAGRVVMSMVLIVIALFIAKWVERSTQRVLGRTKLDLTLCRFFLISPDGLSL